MFQTIGHQKQKDFLANLLEKKQYSHAYLFTGPSEVGKRTLAVEFAAGILGINSKKSLSDLDALQHPDLIKVDAGALAIADVRELIANLSLAPFSAEKKVVVLNNFDQASREVSSSLLKTIEEPNPSTILILVAENYKTLLPTIISRTQRLHFAAVPTSELATAVPTVKNIDLLNGRIGRAIRMSKDLEFAKRFEASAGELSEIKKLPPAERLLKIKELSEREDSELKESIRWWGEAEQAALAERPHTYPNLAACATALSGLTRYFNKKLVLQKLFLDFIP